MKAGQIWPCFFCFCTKNCCYPAENYIFSEAVIAIINPKIQAGIKNPKSRSGFFHAILAIKILSKLALPAPVLKAADINQDGLIGFEEALQALQVISGIKPHP